MNTKYLSRKLARFFFVESHCGLKILVSVALIFAMVLECRILNSQNKRLIAAKAEQVLVERIVLLEKNIKDKLKIKEISSLLRETGKEEAAPFLVQGVLVKKEGFSVVIDNEIYNKGDMFGEYRIMDITDNATVLVNEKTKAMKYIYFPD